jgi:hypothetical protein
MSNILQIEKPATEAKPARFKIAAELDGFPIEIEMEGKADNLKALVERLKTIGAQPPQAKPAAKPGVPICPIHNTPMKASQKPGTFFCPKRTDDGSYCKEKA